MALKVAAPMTRPANMDTNVVRVGQSLASRVFFGTLNAGKAVVIDFPLWSITKHPLATGIALTVGAVVTAYMYKGGIGMFKPTQPQKPLVKASETLTKQLELLNKPETRAEKVKELNALQTTLGEKQIALTNIGTATTDKEQAVAKAQADLTNAEADLKAYTGTTADTKNSLLDTVTAKKAALKAAQDAKVSSKEELELEISGLNIKINAEQGKVLAFENDILVVTAKLAAALKAEAPAK